MYDDAEVDPESIWAYSPATSENEYLTVADLIRFEKQVGRDEQSKRMYMFGERPIGSGEHFPRESLEKCRARWLDDRIKAAIDSKTPGWSVKRASRVDLYSLRIPYEKGGRYIVVADPGWANPPMRNSAVILVWRIDDFPNTPAMLVAFEWVFGNGSPNPWIAYFRNLVNEYHAIGMCGFDATGFQSGYERLHDFTDIKPTPISSAGNKKYIYLTLAKKYFADGLFQIPTITHLFSQLAKYKLPDDKLRQDIVAAMLCTAAMLEPYTYVHTLPPAKNEVDPNDRYYRENILADTFEDRY